MKKNIIIIGMGELGAVFARGFLKLGYPVQAVTREMDMDTVSTEIPDPKAVLVAVGEADIQTTLAQIPSAWQDKLILIQNELLPRDWQAANLPTPTVISVWFEKKKGMDSKVVISSPVFGQFAELIQAALNTLDLPTQILHTEEELLFELVRKNLYILTSNIAGLETGGNVKELAEQHSQLMHQVIADILSIQNWLTQTELDPNPLIEGMLEAFSGDPEHKCMGRSAPTRLARALKIADEASLSVPTLRNIAAKHL